MITDLDNFLTSNRITRDTWEETGLDWNVLKAIGLDHEARSDQLRESAEFFARVLQKCPKVHSVRWRIKDSNHLMEKIVRKRSEKIEKYADIKLENYSEIITDLIGVRALHLFKDDCFDIDNYLKTNWDPVEPPVVYLREGDHDDLKEKFTNEGFEVKSHVAGYRSIHYVFNSKPLKQTIATEIQIRTIFEEGWSEIDHKIRYPNFSENPLVIYFLTIFNRMAGSADEMGSFVKGLVTTLDDHREEIQKVNENSQKKISELEEMVADIENLREQNKLSASHINNLKAEIKKLRSVETLNSTSTYINDYLEKVLSLTNSKDSSNQNSSKHGNPSSTTEMLNFLNLIQASKKKKP